MYRFIGWNKFLEQLRQVRILNLMGAMGTGKTLVAVAIGYHMLRDGRVKQASFNFPVSFNTSPTPRWSYNVVDEAGRIFDNRMAFKSKQLNVLSADLTFGLRKQGSYLVVPSFLDVDKRFRTGLRIWRTFAISRWFWLYHWELGEEETEERREGVNFWEGQLGLVNPGHFFGSYDTYFVPGQQMTFAFLGGVLERDIGHVT